MTQDKQPSPRSPTNSNTDSYHAFDVGLVSSLPAMHPRTSSRAFGLCVEQTKRSLPVDISGRDSSIGGHSGASGTYHIYLKLPDPGPPMGWDGSEMRGVAQANHIRTSVLCLLWREDVQDWLVINISGFGYTM